jgi:phosphatidylglycerol:prolipoprotein diacylglycerol transferase
MFAAIPFFGLGVYNLNLPGVGEVPIDPWAILVCLGFVIGLEISRHRAVKLGLDVRDVVDGAVFTVVAGFVIGHFYTVIFYFPERLQTEGIWALLKVWTGFSSVGGFFGAAIGSLVFYRLIRKRDYLRFADVITYGFPFGWFFGRLGCGVVHDHIGAETSMPWGMDFDRGIKNFVWVDGDPYPWVSGVRHELGLTEAAFMIPIMALWLYLGRKDRVPGFFLTLFFVLYAPIRFVLDFLRIDDATYWGLTPAQYGVAVIFVVGLAVLLKLPYRSFQPWPMDGGPDQAQRAAALVGTGAAPIQEDTLVEIPKEPDRE